jgi:hypothetical protein
MGVITDRPQIPCLDAEVVAELVFCLDKGCLVDGQDLVLDEDRTENGDKAYGSIIKKS